MPHNFDLSAYITKNPDEDNKLVIQIKITDIMTYNNSGNWGNSNQKTDLTWEEQNFMEEQEGQQQQAKPDFAEYEWMMQQDEFDSEAKQRIEQDDDIDDMFYWDPSKGCTAGKAAAKIQQNVHNQQNGQNHQNVQNGQNHQFQNNQNQNSQFQQNPQQSTQFHTQSSSPFTSNFQNSADLKQGFQNFQKAPAQIHQSGFQSYQNPFQAQNQHFQVQKQEVQAGDELSKAMNGVDLNKLNLNPEANAFVPSWLKK